jgi:hypothetical protein
MSTRPSNLAAPSVVSVTTGALFKTAPVVHKSHRMASAMIVSNTEKPRIALAKPPASALGLMSAPPAPEACDASEETPTTSLKVLDDGTSSARVFRELDAGIIPSA